MKVALLDNITLHFHVLHDKVGSIQRISHNSTYESSSQYYSIWLFCIKKLFNRKLIR